VLQIKISKLYAYCKKDSGKRGRGKLTKEVDEDTAMAGRSLQMRHNLFPGPG
jgi:hypothetical protein